MPKFTSADVKDKAKAGLEAFGKDPKKMKGPIKGGNPFAKKTEEEMPVGKGQSKKKGKYK